VYAVPRIDLHTHSTASDGTDAPAEVVAAAAVAGLDVVALTDHDSAAGWVQALAAGERFGVRVVPGIEISCARDDRSIHLLAYHVDPVHDVLVAEMAQTRASRDTRLVRIVERLVAGGIPLTLEEVLAQVPHGATAGRPHIADALVASGTAAHRDEAFARWLHGASPYVVPHYAPDPVVAVRAVLDAGGVAVLAHPFGRGRYRVTDTLVEELAAIGLAGLETGHRDHDSAAVAHAHRLAGRLGLIETGSSDYHGTGKQNRLGEHLTDPAVLDEIDRLADAATGRSAP
jgi:predicted metal-dependent phosphoesterase TrpH